MRGRLLERDAELGRLGEALGRAGRGRGSVVLVSGEAGIGKTALVRTFADGARAQARVLAGVRDDLGTPRTLGPFRDMARAGGGPLVAAADAGAERDAVFDAVHRELAARPTVMIVEDLHWADDATLDVVRWLAWRVAELPSLLVVTYRDDELAADAPLWRLLGALARQDTVRLELAPLSEAAVRELSGAAGADPGAVLGATGGNPFFVTEVLAHYDLVLGWPGPLPGGQRATVLEESVWVLYNLSRFEAAVTRAREVVRQRERAGDPALLGQALTTLSRMLYMVNDPGGSGEAVARAVALLEPLGDRPRLARAATYQAAILKLTDRPEAAIARATEALALGEATGQPDVVAHSLNYLGYAMLDLGDPAGAGHLRRSVEVAGAARHYEYRQRGYTNLVEGLYRLGRFDELDEPITEGLAHARRYGSASHAYNLEAHRCMLLTLRGRFTEAEAGLRRLLAGEDPRVLASFGLSALGRLLARRGGPGAPASSTRPGRPPPGPARSRRSPWPARPGSRRPGWPATPRGRPGWPASRWSGPPPGGPSATGASCCACWPAAAGRPRPSTAARPSTPSASRATGAAPPTPGRRGAPPMSRPWSWPTPGGRRRCWPGCGRSRSSAPPPPPTWSGAGCGAAG